MRVHKVTTDTCRRKEFDVPGFGIMLGGARHRILIINHGQEILKWSLQGLTLVISPLVSLMKDQVDDLVRRGVNAANLDCTQTVDHISRIREQVLSGSLKLLYVAPER